MISPILFFRRLFARRRLRSSGYCTRHLIKMETASMRYRRIWSEVYAGKLIPSSLIDEPCHILDNVFPKPYCELCREEKSLRDEKKLERAMSELGGKLQ